MIEVNGMSVKAEGKTMSVLFEVTLALYSICSHIANKKEDKYALLDKLCSAVKKEIETTDGIGEGDGWDA